MAPEPCLAVPCPLCHAPAGEPCHEIAREHRPRQPHGRRVWRYECERREQPAQADLFMEVR